MKNFTKIIAAIGLTSALTVTATFGQPFITVDELGNGNFNGAPLPSFLSLDPSSGIVTLTYQLPFPGVPGDVLLFEPGPQPAPLSDLLRFDGNFHLFFFSEREATDSPPFDPADVATLPPPNAALPRVSLFETGPEGNNGAFYNPAGGLPGDNTAGANYHFISDVPEPSASALVVLGAGLLLALKKRRQSRRS